MVKAEEPGCEIYVKNDADGKYFPQTDIDGHTYELMTDEKEQRSIAFKGNEERRDRSKVNVQ